MTARRGAAQGEEGYRCGCGWLPAVARAPDPAAEHRNVDHHDKVDLSAYLTKKGDAGGGKTKRGTAPEVAVLGEAFAGMEGLEFALRLCYCFSASAPPPVALPTPAQAMPPGYSEIQLHVPKELSSSYARRFVMGIFLAPQDFGCAAALIMRSWRDRRSGLRPDVLRRIRPLMVVHGGENS